MGKIRTVIVNHYQEFIVLAFALVATYTIASFAIIQKNDSKIYSNNNPTLSEKLKNARVGIVFGGGVTDKEPLPLLRDRLLTAKTLLDKGFIDKVLLSGDNRTLSYNEPAVMYRYLVEELGVEPEKVQQDFAGRSTYETCERANKVFGLSEAILISEETHLPRALYLCKHFGIDSYGVKSSGQASSGLQIGQRWREVLARNKAIFNVYILGEKTILGEPIELN